MAHGADPPQPGNRSGGWRRERPLTPEKAPAAWVGAFGHPPLDPAAITLGGEHRDRVDCSAAPSILNKSYIITAEVDATRPAGGPGGRGFRR